MSGFNRDAFNREVGLLLALARKQANKTQDDIARQLGIPRATYASIEGGRQRITIDVLWRIAVIVGRPVDMLLPAPITTAPTSGTSAEVAPQEYRADSQHVDTSSTMAFGRIVVGGDGTPQP